MVPLTVLGAAVASHGVEHTAGYELLSVAGLAIVVAVAQDLFGDPGITPDAACMNGYVAGMIARGPALAGRLDAS